MQLQRERWEADDWRRFRRDVRDLMRPLVVLILSGTVLGLAYVGITGIAYTFGNTLLAAISSIAGIYTIRVFIKERQQQSQILHSSGTAPRQVRGGVLIIVAVLLLVTPYMLQHLS